MKRAKRTKLSAPICSADFVMPFGKYKGQSLEQISEHDGQYILWLRDEKVIRIASEFSDAVEMDVRELESETRDIIAEHYYDIY